jgi:hypothetical protein
MRKEVAYGAVLSIISLCLTVLVVEFALRVYRDAVFRFDSLIAKSSDPGHSGRFAYDPTLGWVPKPGRFAIDWTANVDASGLRSNGGQGPLGGRTVLAVGDSFTFGDEAEDHQTWPANLERILKLRVLNAGVGAYGIDQAVLRAEQLTAKYRPQVVILAFISDDVSRTEFSAYPWGRGWKPYFELRDGILHMRNVPVPVEPPPLRFEALRSTLGHSYFARFVLQRALPRWWSGLPAIHRVHNDGANVSAALVSRLHHLVQGQGGQFLAVALASDGQIGDNARVEALVGSLREKGVPVLDLSQAILASKKQDMFRSRGHYSPWMYRWVAERIAIAIDGRGRCESSAGQTSDPEKVVRGALRGYAGC